MINDFDPFVLGSKFTQEYTLKYHFISNFMQNNFVSVISIIRETRGTLELRTYSPSQGRT